SSRRPARRSARGGGLVRGAQETSSEVVYQLSSLLLVSHRDTAPCFRSQRFPGVYSATAGAGFAGFRRACILRPCHTNSLAGLFWAVWRRLLRRSRRRRRGPTSCSSSRTSCAPPRSATTARGTCLLPT